MTSRREEWFAALGFAAVMAAPVLYVLFFWEMPA
jgi:hypothetical protein